MQTDHFNERIERAHEFYSRRVLGIYDFMVYSFANPFVWCCPNENLLTQYKKNISANHIDVGVGTGYLLDNCNCTSTGFSLTLMDINQDCLNTTENRLRRYNPRTILQNVFEPLQPDAGKYDSIGVNYLLHCVPGTLKEKCTIISNLKSALNKDGVIFGSTILGINDTPNLTARCLMRIYNYAGIFNNLADNVCELEIELGHLFANVEIQIVGNVALFSARD